MYHKVRMLSLLFFSPKLSLSENFDAKTLKHGIDYYNYCAETDISHHIISPRSHDFVVALVSKSDSVTNITYTHPIGTSPKQFNFESPSYRFPGGDAEIILNLKKDECVTLAYASILKGSCAESFKITTKLNYKENFTSEGIHTDRCVFYAPPLPDNNKFIYTIGGAPGDNIFYVYDREMVHGPCLILSQRMSIKNPGTSSKPVIFRLETTDNLIEANISVSALSSEARSGAVQYEMNVDTIAVEEKGIFSHNYLLPIIGTGPAIILGFAWIYAFTRIYRKKPQPETY